MASDDSRDLRTWGALGALLVMALGFVGLMIVVMPGLIYMFGFLAAFLGFGALHYLVWGWWLGAALTGKQTEDPAERDA